MSISQTLKERCQTILPVVQKVPVFGHSFGTCDKCRTAAQSKLDINMIRISKHGLPENGQDIASVL
eukprot:2997377-Amphidinium_carterae.3